MAKVLVVGGNGDGEQTVLQRLQVLAGMPSGSLSACRDPLQCDVLIVQDSQGLRHAAMRMRKDRPDMPLWVEDSQGMLRDGGEVELPLLCRDAIVSVLTGEEQEQRGSAQVIQIPISEQAKARLAMAKTHGDKQACAVATSAVPVDKADKEAALDPAPRLYEVTRRLRLGIRAGKGYCALHVDSEVLAVLDFATNQAVIPAGSHLTGLAETAQWLGERLDAVSVGEITADEYLNVAKYGQRQPLRALLWQCAQQCKDWTAVDLKLARGAIIHLDGWPDFRVIAGQTDAFRLCAFLIRRPSSLHDCSVILELVNDTVEKFVHGAFLAGYARMVLPTVRPDKGISVRMDNRQPDETHTKETGRFFSRLWRTMRRRAAG